VAAKIQAANFKRVGLLATPTTLNSTLYDEALAGIAETVRPDTVFAEQIERYIYKQLNDTLTQRERQQFRRQVKTFKQANNLDTIILGCTELPLVYGASDTANVIDTLQVLADGLLKEYFTP
jgi:aspartate racemase